MPLSDEKLEQILTVMTDSFQAFQAAQAESSKLNSDLIKMLQQQMAAQETSMSINSQMRAKREMEMDDSHGFTSPMDMMKAKKFSNKARPKRPTVEVEIDDVEWGIFLDKWKIYKAIAELEDHEICMELRETCSTAVYKLLYQFVGSDELNKADITEIDMLAHIKGVAVKSVHKEVHRWNYNQMTQEADEKISKYVGRLKAQAGLCDFNRKCLCGESVSYAEDMIAQRMVAGLTNAEHQSRIISEAEINKDLKSKVDRLITLETTDEATHKLRATEPSRFAALKSQYKASQKQPAPTPIKSQRGRDTFQHRTPQWRRRCRGCGRKNHGNGKPLTREECPAYGQTCDACGMKNHYSKVCNRRRTRANYVRMEDDTSGSECDTSDWSEYEDEHIDMQDEVTHAVHSAAKTEEGFRQTSHHPYRR